ncbi:MAG: DUF5684 domain-containing protein [Ferruginibacter sp.]
MQGSSSPSGFWHQICRAFGRFGFWHHAATVFVPFVYFPYLGFSKVKDMPVLLW